MEIYIENGNGSLCVESDGGLIKLNKWIQKKAERRRIAYGME